MKLTDLVKETNIALTANKGRTFLTMLGIIIGIVSVVVMVSIVSGFETWLEDQIGLGSARVITVTCEDNERSLSSTDADFLLEVCDNLETAIPTASTTASVDSQVATDDEDSSVSLYVVGADPDYFTMENMTLAYGSLYAADSGMAIILDENAAEAIFGSASQSLIGSSIDIDSNTYEICGIVESQSALLSAMSISMAYLPYTTACEALIGSTQIDSILVKVADEGDVEYAAAQIEGVLAARHSVEYDEDGEQSVYSASTSSTSLSYLSTFTLAFDALAALVAGIALLVGGIGIMNMMLTNVTERFREIGLRKSLGARPRDITLQFLSESVALCVAGGIVGIVLGYAGAYGLCNIVVQLYPDVAGLTPVIKPSLVAIVFGVCTAIGIIFGYYPARRASKLNPTETLRYQ